MNGILNLYKEKGFTSFDAVAVLRGILHEKKIGHAGTLDPDAEGVLVVCVGKATKLVELLTGHDKTYEAVMKLGVTTDTQDASGNVLATRPVCTDPDEIRAAAASFTGRIQQVPPMYSALKVNGKRLYDLARAGKEVERKPREITVYSIDVTDISLPYVSLTVCCSKGTYIRTLCADIGARLGCGAVMQSLIRVRSGDFSAENAMTLSEVRDAMEAHMFSAGKDAEPAFLIPIDRIFSSLPACRADKEEEKLLRNGNPVRTEEAYGEGSLVRMYMPDGQFAGIYRYDAGKKQLRVHRMFL